MAAQKNKLQQLADLTAAAELSTPEPVLPEETFPQVVRDPRAPAPQMPSIESQVRRPTDPAPQMPMLKEILSNNRPQNVDPDMPEEVGAALAMVGLIAHKSIGFWKVMLPNASTFTSNGGGGQHTRWQTGVSIHATTEQWLAEINRFWKDIHPGEPLPFGQV